MDLVAPQAGQGTPSNFCTTQTDELGNMAAIEKIKVPIQSEHMACEVTNELAF